jgi:hypothetical protein
MMVPIDLHLVLVGKVDPKTLQRGFVDVATGPPVVKKFNDPFP